MHPDILGLGPTLSSITLIHEAFSWEPVGYRGNPGITIVGPARQRHGPIVEEEFQRCGQNVPFDAAAPRESAVIGYVQGFQIRLKDLPVSARVKTLERRGLCHRPECAGGHLFTSDQACLLPGRRAIHNRRCVCAGILRPKREGPVHPVNAATEPYNSTRLERAVFPCHAQGVSCSLQSSERFFLGAGIGVAARSGHPILQSNVRLGMCLSGLPCSSLRPIDHREGAIHRERPGNAARPGVIILRRYVEDHFPRIPSGLTSLARPWYPVPGQFIQIVFDVCVSIGREGGTIAFAVRIKTMRLFPGIGHTIVVAVRWRSRRAGSKIGPWAAGIDAIGARLVSHALNDAPINHIPERLVCSNGGKHSVQ